MSEHFIVTLEHGRLRIYAARKEPGQRVTGLQQVEAVDIPGGSEAGFASGRGSNFARNLNEGGLADERLTVNDKADRRSQNCLAEEVEAFFSNRPTATWDFAAGPELYRSMLEQLSSHTRQRLRCAVVKDLVKQSSTELLASFAQAA